MKLVDGHSHLFHAPASVGNLKIGVSEIEGFDAGLLVQTLDQAGLSLVQTMPQEMSRIQDRWLGSNPLSADIARCVPDRVVAFAGAEPLDRFDALNRARLKEIERAVRETGLKGLLLTPPYGHYYSNDKRVYPFYELAMELDIPVYFHHSHMFGDPKRCPLKYARIWLLDDLVIDFPGLRINVEHMGYPWTEELLAIMSRSPNVYTDIAMFVAPYVGRGRPLLLARNLGMAGEYGVLDRVFYGSDYVGESLHEYRDLIQRETGHILNKLSGDMERFGYPPLTPQEQQGLLADNVLRLWKR